MWHAPDDPQIFGALELDARPLLDLVARERQHGRRVTATHLVGRAVAHALAKVPELNVRIRGGRAYPRDSVDVFFITAVEGGRDLSGVKIRDVDRRSALEVADELAQRSASLRRGEDRDFSRAKRFMDALPPRVLRPVIRAAAWLTEDLALDVPALGLHRAPFGSAMVTSVGMFGVPQGFAPLAWMYGVPLLVLVGEITPRPVVVGGRVEPRDTLPICATIDHRYADGWHVSQAMAAFREYLAAPARFEPAGIPMSRSTSVLH
jgi:pyruvate/2-oxoglutarate dehydrogenase complex dihydrolipoamide acyltransferase (E2) component